MPFDSNGVFSRVMNWTSDMQNGIAIECGRHDAEDNNFAEGFNDTFCRDGRAAATGNFDLGNHKIQKLASGTATTDAVNKGQLDTVADSVSTLDGNVVHLAGAQTITGAKTFTSDVSIANGNPYIELHDNDFIKGNLPSSERAHSIYTQDKTSGISQSNRLGVFATHIQTSGTVVTFMQAYKNVANSTDYASIGVYYPTSGSPYTYAPTPTDTTITSGTQIATTGWVNSVGNNIVHLSGAETITGRKVYTDTTTFTTHPVVQSTTENSSIGYRVQNTQITRGTTPTTGNATGQLVFQDSGGLGVNNRIGGMEVTYLTDGSIRTTLQAFQPAASTTQNPYTYSSLALIYPESGNPYTYCPASDVANSIVTTVNKNKSANGYFQFGNGLIVQWGYKANNGTHTVTVTLPKAFTTTNYAVTVSRYSNEWAEGVMMQTNNYKKTSFDLTVNDPGAHWIAIGY